MIVIFTMFISTLNAQPYVKNGSFETYDSLPRCVSDTYHDELTRCIGDYTGSVPAIDNRHLPKSQGGCDGWYVPGEGTTDYYNRAVDRYDTNQYKIWVPENKANNYGNNNIIQQPFDDDHDAIIEDLPDNFEDGYIGIYNYRFINDTIQSGYAEFVSQRLQDSLIAGHWYRVSFKVSRAMPGDTVIGDNPTGHSIRKIGAFFTLEKFSQFTTHPYNAADTDMVSIIYKNDRPGEFLDQTGGSDGMNWMNVGDLYCPYENKHFITLGNFDNYWDSTEVRNEDSISVSDFIRVYYYIDSVSIVETFNESCNCGSLEGTIKPWNIIVKPQQKVFGSDSCCFDVYIKANSNFNLLCHITRAVVYKNYQYTEIDSSYYFDNGSQYITPEREYYIGTKCLGNEEAFPSMYIKVFDQSNYKCQFPFYKEIRCCDCDSLEASEKFTISIDSSSQNEDMCCWQINVQNNSDCIYQNVPISITLDSSGFANAQFSEIDWIGYQSTIEYTYTWNWENFGRTTNPVIIGGVCVPRDGNAYPYTIKFMDYDGQTSSVVSCGDSITGELLCACCDKIHFPNIESEPYSDAGAACCFWYSFQIDSSLAICGGINKILFVTMQDSVIWDSGDSSITYGNTLDSICLPRSVFGSVPDTLGIKLYFLNYSDNIICEYSDSLYPCSNIIQPCYPSDSAQINWLGPMDDYIDITCPGETTACHVDFQFYYRIIEVGGTILYRDVQVVYQSYNSTCTCWDEIVQNILKKVWERPEVRLVFRIDENVPEGETVCFDNFRVITSDCWETMPYSNPEGGPVY
ncbi:MAG: type sorting protein, partial [Bacteroidota bacterium]|nr:type sorting protein [Bacteroidota bacterium]